MPANNRTRLLEKLSEALRAVVPIIVIVLILSFTIAPISTSILLCFLMGAVLVILGMMFFTLGAELAMTPIGDRVGGCLSRFPNLALILIVAFIVGAVVTISEPDLQVLAGQIPSVPDMTLIMAVAAGVGLSLMIAILRMLLGIPLVPILAVFYILTFVLAVFVPGDFIGVSFDAGGVTTGPMTVPFIMALGAGISSIRGDSNAENDSFGLVSICSIGPIIAVMILSILYQPDSVEFTATAIPAVTDSTELAALFAKGFPEYIREIAVSLAPIAGFFAVFQIFLLKLKKTPLTRIVIGLVYTYVGLVLFLTGANVGFMPAGSYLGSVIAALPFRVVIIPIGMIIGYFIVKAEPAVYVLNEQVEELTNGLISAASMGRALSAGVAVSIGISMLRVLTGIPVIYFLVPGYALALILTLFVPRIFTAIAFDSGGVASGPMTAAFLLPFAQGACMAVGGNVVSDAFGVVAMVAMTPLITVQMLGLIYKLRSRSAEKRVITGPVASLAGLDDDVIIEL